MPWRIRFCTLLRLYCTFQTAHLKMYPLPFTLHTKNCTLHTAHCTLHTATQGGVAWHTRSFKKPQGAAGRGQPRPALPPTGQGMEEECLRWKQQEVNGGSIWHPRKCNRVVSLSPWVTELQSHWVTESLSVTEYLSVTTERFPLDNFKRWNCLCRWD